jgi:hypothetical protein
MTVVDERAPVALEARGVALKNLDELWRFAQAVVKSGIAPMGDKPEAVMVKIQAGLELGISPMRAMQNLVVFNGRLSMMEKLATALVRSSGKVAFDGQLHTWFEGDVNPDGSLADNYTCYVSSRRVDEAKPTVTSFSVKDAKTARLWNKSQSAGVSPWVAYPKRMLQARCRQHHIQDNYSDVTMGIATAEGSIGDDPVYVDPRSRIRATKEITQPSVLQLEKQLEVTEEIDPLFADDMENVAAETLGAPVTVAGDGSVEE